MIWIYLFLIVFCFVFCFVPEGTFTGNRDILRSTELPSLSGRWEIGVHFPYRASVPAGRGGERWRPFYRALAPDGAIRDRCGFAQACTARRRVPPVQQFRKAQQPQRMPCPDRYNNSVKGRHRDGCLVPKGHKLGRRPPSRQMPCPEGTEAR